MESQNSSSDEALGKTIVPLLRTPLFDQIVALKARMVAFSGWDMPVQYEGISREHEAIRTRVGMFDISHMGKFLLRGRHLVEDLQYLVPSDLSRLKSGEAQYTVLLTPEAGIIDDLIFYYQGVDEEGEQRGVMIVNAATTLKDKTWLLKHLDSQRVFLEDISTTHLLIAVQGPQALTQLQAFVKEDLSAVKPFGHLNGTVLGHPAFLARTGYTGEDGFEVMLEPDAGLEFWRSLLDAGVTPCGLGARDTLRLEAAMALYGQDIDETTTPLEAGLGWLVHLETKGDFIGRSVLEEQKRTGVQRKLVGLQMQGRNIARHGYPVKAAGQSVGVVTSGSFTPTLGQAIALAYVPTALAKPGQSLEVEIRGKTFPGTVVKRPFYRSPHR